MELQRQGHDVVVLTRSNNRAAIETYLAAHPGDKHPAFVYFDLSSPFLFLKRTQILPLQVYYALWQFFCVATARKAAADHRVDIVWHLTFGVVRWASFLWRLKIPFVFGPLGGGETAPLRMRGEYPWGGYLRDMLRDILNTVSRLDPTLRSSFTNADLILVKTPQSGALVPRRLQHKVRVFLEVGVQRLAARKERAPQGRILYAGGFIYLKGITLAIRAFAEFIRCGGTGRFTLVGQGPEEERGRALTKALSIDHLVDWVSWVEQRELSQIYGTHDLFLFPSLHDSSGNVVVEALSHGLPVVCFDLGGPGQIVTNDCGAVVPTSNLSTSTAVRSLAQAMGHLLEDHNEYRRLSAGAQLRAADFTWTRRVSHAMEELRAVPAIRALNQ